MQLADDAGVRPGRPCPDAGTATPLRSKRAATLERLVDGLDGALGGCEPALDDPGEVPALFRERVPAAAGRRARSRTARSPSLPASTLRRRGLDEARQQGRPQLGHLRGHRQRDPERVRLRVRGDEARRVDLREPAADEDVLQQAAEPLLAASAGRTSPAAAAACTAPGRAPFAPPPRRGRPRG